MYLFDIWENFFSERLIRYFKMLHKVMVESLSLEVFKKRIDVALRDLV